MCYFPIAEIPDVVEIAYDEDNAQKKTITEINVPKEYGENKLLDEADSANIYAMKPVTSKDHATYNGQDQEKTLKATLEQAAEYIKSKKRVLSGRKDFQKKAFQDALTSSENSESPEGSRNFQTTTGYSQQKPLTKAFTSADDKPFVNKSSDIHGSLYTGYAQKKTVTDKAPIVEEGDTKVAKKNIMATIKQLEENNSRAKLKTLNGFLRRYTDRDLLQSKRYDEWLRTHNHPTAWYYGIPVTGYKRSPYNINSYYRRPVDKAPGVIHDDTYSKRSTTHPFYNYSIQIHDDKRQNIPHSYISRPSINMPYMKRRKRHKQSICECDIECGTGSNGGSCLNDCETECNEAENDKEAMKESRRSISHIKQVETPKISRSNLIGPPNVNLQYRSFVPQYRNKAAPKFVYQRSYPLNLSNRIDKHLNTKSSQQNAILRNSSPNSDENHKKTDKNLKRSVFLQSKGTAASFPFRMPSYVNAIQYRKNTIGNAYGFNTQNQQNVINQYNRKNSLPATYQYWSNNGNTQYGNNNAYTRTYQYAGNRNNAYQYQWYGDNKNTYRYPGLSSRTVPSEYYVKPSPASYYAQTPTQTRYGDAFRKSYKFQPQPSTYVQSPDQNQYYPKSIITNASTSPIPSYGSPSLASKAYGNTFYTRDSVPGKPHIKNSKTHRFDMPKISSKVGISKGKRKSETHKYEAKSTHKYEPSEKAHEFESSKETNKPKISEISEIIPAKADTRKRFVTAVKYINDDEAAKKIRTVIGNKRSFQNHTKSRANETKILLNNNSVKNKSKTNDHRVSHIRSKTYQNSSTFNSGKNTEENKSDIKRNSTGTEVAKTKNSTESHSLELHNNTELGKRKNNTSVQSNQILHKSGIIVQDNINGTNTTVDGKRSTYKRLKSGIPYYARSSKRIPEHHAIGSKRNMGSKGMTNTTEIESNNDETSEPSISLKETFQKFLNHEEDREPFANNESKKGVYVEITGKESSKDFYPISKEGIDSEKEDKIDKEEIRHEKKDEGLKLQSLNDKVEKNLTKNEIETSKQDGETKDLGKEKTHNFGNLKNLNSSDLKTVEIHDELSDKTEDIEMQLNKEEKHEDEEGAAKSDKKATGHLSDDDKVQKASFAKAEDKKVTSALEEAKLEIEKEERQREKSHEVSAIKEKEELSDIGKKNDEDKEKKQSQSKEKSQSVEKDDGGKEKEKSKNIEKEKGEKQNSHNVQADKETEKVIFDDDVSPLIVTSNEIVQHHKNDDDALPFNGTENSKEVKNNSIINIKNEEKTQDARNVTSNGNKTHDESVKEGDVKIINKNSSAVTKPAKGNGNFSSPHTTLIPKEIESLYSDRMDNDEYVHGDTYNFNDMNHDAGNGDWFDQGFQPDAKTKQDLSMSKSGFLNKLIKAQRVIMERKKEPSVPEDQSQKQVEAKINNIVKAAESTEQSELQNLITESIGNNENIPNEINEQNFANETPINEDSTMSLNSRNLNKNSSDPGSQEHYDVDIENEAIKPKGENNDIEGILADYKDEFSMGQQDSIGSPYDGKSEKVDILKELKELKEHDLQEIDDLKTDFDNSVVESKNGTSDSSEAKEPKDTTKERKTEKMKEKTVVGEVKSPNLTGNVNHHTSLPEVMEEITPKETDDLIPKELNVSPDQSDVIPKKTELSSKESQSKKTTEVDSQEVDVTPKEIEVSASQKTELFSKNKEKSHSESEITSKEKTIASHVNVIPNESDISGEETAEISAKEITTEVPTIKDKKYRKQLDRDEQMDFDKINEKWQKVIEENKYLSEDLIDNTPSIDNKGAKGENLLASYFKEVESKQGLDEGVEMNKKQQKRQKKIKATLAMINDIESQIDGMIHDSKGDKKLGYMKEKKSKKRGKAAIFSELIRSHKKHDTEIVDEDDPESEKKGKSSEETARYIKGSKKEIEEDLDTEKSIKGEAKELENHVSKAITDDINELGEDEKRKEELEDNDGAGLCALVIFIPERKRYCYSLNFRICFAHLSCFYLFFILYFELDIT